MTPQPPSSPEDPANPPGPRREKDPGAARDLEPDLWDLDEQTKLQSPPTSEPESTKGGEIDGIEQPVKIKDAPPEPVQIEPRIIAKKAAGKVTKKTAGTAKGESSSKARAKAAPLEKTGPPKPEKTAASKLSADFDDLDSFDDLGSFDDLDDLDDLDSKADESVPTPVGPDPAAQASVEESPPPALVGTTVESQPEPPHDTAETTLPDTTSTAGGTGVALLLRPLLTLSRLEKIGLAVLLAILLIGTVLILGHWLTRLPTESIKAQGADFPITGDSIIAVSAETYWRVPITEGPDADRFRRGTELLPVANLTFRGGPAAIRVFFRNDSNQLVGDAVTRMISGETSMKIAATGGFDDLGMHAAYRTGESKPWIVQVFEGPSVNAPSAEFELLFETSISSDRR